MQQVQRAAPPFGTNRRLTTMASLAETASNIAGQIGKYFSVASLLPSLLFVVWCLALRGAGAPLTDPNLNQARDAVMTWTPPKFWAVLIAALVLGLVVHPLLFATIQLLEGYWGHHPLAVRLAVARSAVHRAKLTSLLDAADRANDEIEEFTTRALTAEWGEEKYAERSRNDPLILQRREVLASEEGIPIFATYVAQEAAWRAATRYPEEGHRVLPTRLGNALRRAEDRVGTQYGLDAVVIAPHITVVAAPERAAYIHDSRQELDVSVRLCFFALVAAAITALWLASTGWWVFIAVIPYVGAYLTYRGAVAAAGEWGAALAASVDLDRFALYEALHLQMPSDTSEERTNNMQLMNLIRAVPDAVVKYAETSSAAPAVSGHGSRDS